MALFDESLAVRHVRGNDIYGEWTLAVFGCWLSGARQGGESCEGFLWEFPVKPQRIEMQWPAQKLEKALARVIDEQAFSPLRKARMKKALNKRVKQGTLEVSNMDTEWLYRLCCAALMLHDYHWFAWEWRSQFASELATKPFVYPNWDGSRCKLLVIAEQGIGDEIVFSSCYHELAEDVEEAWIEVDPRLIPIFTRSFPENLHFVDRFVLAGKNVVPRLSDYPKFHEGVPIEAFVPAGNVPKLYRQSVDDFPGPPGDFLEPDYSLVEKWHSWLPPPEKVPNIGCSWKGRQGLIEPIEAGVSLQYGTDDHKGLLVPPIDLKRDLEDVFALIVALRKVVTTTNAVAHFAGSLGVETHCVKPYPIFATKEDGFNNRTQSWWPYDKSDWYPSVIMYSSPQAWEARQ